jgi:lipoate-protein ligase A
MWRLLHSAPASGAFNMALDEAMMSRAVEAGVWILRVYSWGGPTLSLGRNQVARGGYDLAMLAERCIDVVRRPTGGRAILHHREVTYSVAAPLQEAGDLAESYARINRLLIAALRTLGVDASVVVGEPRSRINETPAVDRPGLLPCFHHPSIGEITFADRKLIGSAQWRSHDALLQHGSILIDDDQMQLSSLLLGDQDDIPPAATLRGALGRVPSEWEMVDALFGAVRKLEDPYAGTMTVDESLLECANSLRAHYLDESWTWRR